MYNGFEYSACSTFLQDFSADTIPKVVVRRFGAREIAPQGQEVESAPPPRTAGQPGRETRRGKEHVGKAAKREGM